MLVQHMCMHCLGQHRDNIEYLVFCRHLKVLQVSFLFMVNSGVHAIHNLNAHLQSGNLSSWLVNWFKRKKSVLMIHQFKTLPDMAQPCDRLLSSITSASSCQLAVQQKRLKSFLNSNPRRDFWTRQEYRRHDHSFM